MQAGIAIQYAKPMMAAEMRRIIPTCVGLPVEFGFYTAAVAAAAINGTITSVLKYQLKNKFDTGLSFNKFNQRILFILAHSSGNYRTTSARTPRDSYLRSVDENRYSVAC